MELPMVNVVVVGYNHGKYFLENLDSINNQTYKNINLIIADDASKDNSVSIIESWLFQNHVKATKIFNDTNKGLAKTLNSIFPLLHGKYTKIIAADDFLHPECIEKSVNKLEKLGDHYGMLFTNIFAVDDHSNIKGEYANYDHLGNVDKEYFRKELIKSNRIAALSVLMRTNILLNTGFYPENFLCEDYYRWLKINEISYTGYLSDKLAYYRVHSANISTVRKDRLEREGLLLKILFDKNGIVKNLIDENILIMYYKNTIDSEIISYYKKYKYRSNILLFFLNKRYLFLVFRIFHKLRII